MTAVLLEILLLVLLAVANGVLAMSELASVRPFRSASDQTQLDKLSLEM